MGIKGLRWVALEMMKDGSCKTPGCRLRGRAVSSLGFSGVLPDLAPLAIIFQPHLAVSLCSGQDRDLPTPQIGQATNLARQRGRFFFSLPPPFDCLLWTQPLMFVWRAAGLGDDAR